MARLKRSKRKAIKVSKTKRAKKSPKFKYAFNPATVKTIARLLTGGFTKNKYGKFTGSTKRKKR